MNSAFIGYSEDLGGWLRVCCVQAKREVRLAMGPNSLDRIWSWPSHRTSAEIPPALWIDQEAFQDTENLGSVTVMTLQLMLLGFLPLYHRAVFSLCQFPMPQWRNLYQWQTEFYLCLSPPLWRSQLQHEAGERQFSECRQVKNLVVQYTSSMVLCPRA